MCRICIFLLHMCAFVHMSRRHLCVVGKIAVGPSKVPRSLTVGIRKLCDSVKIRKDSSTLAYWNIFFTCFISVLFFFFQEEIIYTTNSVSCFLVFLFFFLLTLRPMRKIMKEKSRKFETTTSPKAERSPMRRRRRRRRRTGLLPLRSHGEELKCSPARFHRQSSAVGFFSSCSKINLPTEL